MKIKKLIEKIKGFLPITRKSYLEDLKNIYIIVQGLQQAEAQHAQMEMNLISSVEQLKATTVQKKQPNNNKKYDPAYE